MDDDYELFNGATNFALPTTRALSSENGYEEMKQALHRISAGADESVRKKSEPTKTLTSEASAAAASTSPSNHNDETNGKNDNDDNDDDDDDEMTASFKAYDKILRLADGTMVEIRGIRADDVARHRRLFDSHPPEDRYFRYFCFKSQLSEEELKKMCDVDARKEIALVAIALDDKILTKGDELGVVRCFISGSSAEFAIILHPKSKSKHIGSSLMRHVLELLDEWGLETVEGHVLMNNTGMLSLAKHLGFKCEKEEEKVMHVEKILSKRISREREEGKKAAKKK